jgi:hypothetical protein
MGAAQNLEPGTVVFRHLGHVHMPIQLDERLVAPIRQLPRLYLMKKGEIASQTGNTIK